MRFALPFTPADAQLLAWRHGWSLPLGVLAAALAVIAHYALYVPLRSDLVTASTELAQGAIAGPAAQPMLPDADERQQLLQIQSTLRSGAEATDVIRRLGELAAAEQIRLAQGEYQQQFHPRTQLLQLQVTQPVKASYPQVKRYIHSVLRTMPNVSLDQVHARRENVAQAQLEVRLRWSFWIHAPEGRP